MGDSKLEFGRSYPNKIDKTDIIRVPEGASSATLTLIHSKDQAWGHELTGERMDYLKVQFNNGESTTVPLNGLKDILVTNGTVRQSFSKVQGEMIPGPDGRNYAETKSDSRSLVNLISSKLHNGMGINTEIKVDDRRASLTTEQEMVASNNLDAAMAAAGDINNLPAPTEVATNAPPGSSPIAQEAGKQELGGIA